MWRRDSRWIWPGRVVFVLIVVGLAIYLALAGLDKADKLASAIGLLVALCALAAPYLLPARQGAANTTQRPAPGRLVQASGAGSVAVGGDSTGAVTTAVSGAAPATGTPPVAGDPGVTAGGSGSVAIGGTSTGPIRTSVTGPGADQAEP